MCKDTERLVQVKTATLPFGWKQLCRQQLFLLPSVQDPWQWCPEVLSLHRLLALRGVVDGLVKFKERKDQLLSLPLPCAHGVRTTPMLLGGKLAFTEGFPLLWFSISGNSSLSLGVALSLLCLTWVFVFLGSSWEGLDGHGKLTAHNMCFFSFQGLSPGLVCSVAAQQSFLWEFKICRTSPEWARGMQDVWQLS